MMFVDLTHLDHPILEYVIDVIRTSLLASPSHLDPSSSFDIRLDASTLSTLQALSYTSFLDRADIFVLFIGIDLNAINTLLGAHTVHDTFIHVPVTSLPVTTWNDQHILSRIASSRLVQLIDETNILISRLSYHDPFTILWDDCYKRIFRWASGQDLIGILPDGQVPDGQGGTVCDQVLGEKTAAGIGNTSSLPDRIPTTGSSADAPVTVQHPTPLVLSAQPHPLIPAQSRDDTLTCGIEPTTTLTPRTPNISRQSPIYRIPQTSNEDAPVYIATQELYNDQSIPKAKIRDIHAEVFNRTPVGDFDDFFQATYRPKKRKRPTALSNSRTDSTLPGGFVGRSKTSNEDIAQDVLVSAARPFRVRVRDQVLESGIEGGDGGVRDMGARLSPDGYLKLLKLAEHTVDTTLSVADCRTTTVRYLPPHEAMRMLANSFEETRKADGRPPERPQSLISHEVSQLPVGDFVTPAEFVRYYDLETRIRAQHTDQTVGGGTRSRRKGKGANKEAISKAGLLKYVHLADAGATSPFHVDFKGTCTLLWLIEGQKVFFLVPPTRANIQGIIMAEFSAPRRPWTPINPGDLMKVRLTTGQALFLPAGWGHAVYTVQPSYMIMSNFNHDHDYVTQAFVIQTEYYLGYRDDEGEWDAHGHLLLHYQSALDLLYRLEGLIPCPLVEDVATKRVLIRSAEGRTLPSAANLAALGMLLLEFADEIEFQSIRFQGIGRVASEEVIRVGTSILAYSSRVE